MPVKLVNSVNFQKKSNMKDEKYGTKTEIRNHHEEILPTPDYLNALSQFLERRKPEDKIETSRSSKPDKSSSVNYEKFQSGKINDSLQKHVFKFTTSPEFSSDAIRVTHSEPVPRRIRYNSTKKERNDINEAIKHQSCKNDGNNVEVEHGRNKFRGDVEIINFSELKLSKDLEPKDFGGYCEWRFGFWNYSSVAIRRVKSHSVQNVDDFFDAEIHALLKLRHPNILILMGFTKDTANSTMVVYETFQYSLYTYLHEMVGSMPLSKVVKISTQIAEGIHYANKAGLIHTNLSSHCILLSTDTLPKICAFDNAVKRGHTVDKNIDRNQWYQWLAPEFFRPRALIGTPLLDIYSLCVILWECCFLSVPWFNISKCHLTQIYIEWKMGLTINSEFLPKEILMILRKGLIIDPHSRTITVKDIILLLKDVKLSEPSDEPGLRQSVPDYPERVIVKKWSTSEPDLKYAVNSSTTPSPKSLSSHNQSPKVVSRLPTRIRKLVAPHQSSDSSVKQIIADHESFLQLSRDSVNYVNIDHTHQYVINTEIKPASHRTGAIKIPASGLNQTTTPNTSNLSSSYNEPPISPTHNVSVISLRKFFERSKPPKGAQKPIFQKVIYTDYNFIRDLVTDLVDVATEPKSFKSELTVEIKTSDNINIPTEEFERVNFEVFMIFVKLYNRFMSSYSAKETPRLTLNSCLKTQVQELYEQSKLYPENFFTHPTFNYWSSMLRFFLKTMLEDKYFDDDFSADSLKLSSSK